jgi:hypothetical protein
MRQFGDQTAGNQPGDGGHCAQCEAMLADALDGTLSTEDQALFDLHMAACGPCSQMLADARRGAAWLEMLRTPPPEPPADLLARILAQTSGAQPTVAAFHGATPTHSQQPLPALAPGYAMPPVAYGNVIPFRVRAAAAFRSSSFGHIVLQPRLAMTAAMAFFSVALTMSLTGIHPLSLRASDLAPSSLKRHFYAADARAVQYYEGLRVVYELESRVHDLESAQDSDAASGNPVVPPVEGQTPAAQPAPTQSAPQPGSDQPDSDQPGGKPQGRSKSAPNSGSSRREEPIQSRRLVVAYTQGETGPGNSNHVRVGRTLV